MLRRVTDLAALGGEGFGAAVGTHRGTGAPFIEFSRRRGRSSACASLVGLAWTFDPPATTQHDPDRLEAYSFDQNSLDA